MTKKEWLSRATNLDIEIKALESAKQTAFELSDYQSPSFTERVQTGQNNSTENKVIKYIDYVNQLDQMQDKLYQIKQDVLHSINSLESSKDRAVMIDYFILGKDTISIGESLNPAVSQDTVRRIINNAVSCIEIPVNAVES